MSNLVCDFCCSEDDADKITWDYPANTFTLNLTVPFPTVYTSHGHWGACVTCHKLIESNKREELLQRSLEKFFSNAGINIKIIQQNTLQAMSDSIRLVHNGFFMHRTGPCRLVK